MGSIALSISEKAAPPLVFGEGVQWKTLTPLEEPVFYPTVSTESHAQTVGPEEVLLVRKRNFGETFDRPPFIGIYKVDILYIFKISKIDPKTKKVMQKTMALIKGGPIKEFLRENNINHTSLPHEWFDPFLPRILTCPLLVSIHCYQDLSFLFQHDL